MDSSHILIAEDSSVIRKALKNKLEKYGAKVTQAKDGQQALEIALSNKFDLIISDIDMPRLDGFSLCEKLKNIPGTRSIPVIILSSHDSDSDIDRGFQIGAAAYIQKSEASSHLQDTIDKVLRKATFQRERLILIADDSPTIRNIVEKGLAEAGFQVATAVNGKLALESIKSRRPDLILSDINMPEMDGIDFCKKVRSDPDLATIPFMVMSSNNDRAIVRRMLYRGASAYIVKPFIVEQLVITVEKLLSDQFLLLLKDRERLESERKMMLMSITSLIEALEARDHYTRGHSEAVAMIVSEMASKMNMSSDEIEILRVAGRLHDLGKIGVPDSVLLKPGGLTDKEFDIIKKHPKTGAEILGKIPTLKEVIPVILYHHEQMDGKGYPEGLKGNQIPLSARMTAVADTFHALISDRPYRQGMPQEKALKIIQNIRGNKLCPECADVFLDWFKE